jgi:GH24 family phage-related lysozyme (muramidase)
MLFSLEATKIKLEADRADTQLKIAAIYTPPLSDTPLKQLVTEKQSNEVAEQQAQDRLDRQNNWDVALQVGVHQQVNPLAHDPQPYGAVSVSYNLGSRAIDRHLDHAVASYGDWKKVQEGDVVRSMEILRQQLEANITVDESKLNSLEKQRQVIESNLAAVADPDTSAAIDFNNQLAAARLLLEIESGDASYRLTHLRDYLAKNF